MEFKFRGDVVLYEVLEIKTDSKLIVKTSVDDLDKMIFKVRYVGETVEGIKPGDEVILKSVKNGAVRIPGEVLFITNPHNIVCVVSGRECETYSAVETQERMQLATPAQVDKTSPMYDADPKYKSSLHLPGIDFDM